MAAKRAGLRRSGAAFGFLGSLRGSKDPESRKRKDHHKQKINAITVHSRGTSVLSVELAKHQPMVPKTTLHKSLARKRKDHPKQRTNTLTVHCRGTSVLSTELAKHQPTVPKTTLHKSLARKRNSSLRYKHGILTTIETKTISLNTTQTIIFTKKQPKKTAGHKCNRRFSKLKAKNYLRCANVSSAFTRPIRSCSSSSTSCGNWLMKQQHTPSPIIVRGPSGCAMCL